MLFRSDNTFCQAAAEQLQMQAGVFIGSARFLWHNIPVSHAISGIHQAYRDVKNPAEAQDRQKAQLHMAATVAKAAFGGRTWAGITARMEVADAVVNAWKGMSTTQKSAAVTETFLTIGTALLTARIPGPAVGELLEGAASRAAATVGPGSGAVYGTRMHVAFRAEVEALGIPGLRTEVSYVNGVEVPYGTPGSVRIDVGHFDAAGQIQGVFDLKTGSATLTPARTQQIQQAVGSQVPVKEIR